MLPFNILGFIKLFIKLKDFTDFDSFIDQKKQDYS